MKADVQDETVKPAAAKLRRLAVVRLLLVLGLMCCLFVPLLQQWTALLPEYPLGGVESPPARVVLSFRSWHDGSYAGAFETRYNQSFGWRPMLIMLANQFRYEVFGQLPQRSGTQVSIGKYGWLYENAYLRHYSGRAQQPRESDGVELLADLTVVRQALAARGIGFAIVVSPSKPLIYPEYLPDEITRPEAPALSYYDVLVPAMRQAGLPLFDAQLRFSEWKDSQETLLFAPGGTHWNYVGAFMALGAILDLWRGQLDVKVPQPQLKDVVRLTPRGTDDDLARLLNLFRFGTAESRQVPFPVILPDTRGESRPLRVGIVGDSFGYTLVDALSLARAASEISFMYYARRKIDYTSAMLATADLQRHGSIAGTPVETTDFDWVGWLEGCDAVIFETNVIMLQSEFWGAAKTAAKAFRANGDEY